MAVFSDKWRFLALTAAVWLSPLVLAGETADEQRMGDDAFASGDYVNAMRFYSSALSTAGDDDAKASLLLRLGSARLRAGDQTGAKAALGEFVKAFPSRSAGVLPGEIMAFAGKYPEAAEYFDRLAGTPGLTSDEVAAAKFAHAAMQRHLGDTAAVITELDQLAAATTSLPEWRERIAYALTEALIEGGRFERAALLLNSGIAAKKPGYELLKAKLAIKKGDFEGFESAWKLLPARNPGVRDDARSRVARDGAALAMKNAPPDMAAAQTLLEAAFDLAATGIDRRNIMRELININGSDAEKTDQAVSRYLEFFPDASDRAELLLRSARLLAESGRTAAAFGRYREMAEDGHLPGGVRFAAAREGAGLPGSRAEVEAMLAVMAATAADPAQRAEADMAGGEHYFALHDFERAEKYFTAAASSGTTRVDEARFRLLRTLIEERKFKAAAPIASQLAGAVRTEHREAAAYYNALLIEKSNDFAGARKAYKRFAIDFPKSEFAAAAAYAAAELSCVAGDFATAQREFLAFADRYSKSTSAPAALYMALQSACFSGEWKAAAGMVARLDRDYADTHVPVEARLQLADFMRAAGKAADAEQLMAEVEKMPRGKSDAATAEILIDRARLAAGKDDIDRALTLAREALDKYPTTPNGAEAALFAGNLESDRGNYADAIKHYIRAAELNPERGFAEICAGRIADCRFNIFSISLDRAEMEAAVAAYSKLGVNALDPRVRLQSVYKLGRGLELSGDTEAACAAYERAVYLAADLLRGGIAPDPVWTSRAAAAAARLQLASGDRGKAENALAILRRCDEMKLDGAEDFSAQRARIVEKYNLYKRNQ
ncbi:MAG: hypothetical protein PHI35_02510 [Victivallaceae bacterium]|nr:hypothetical protein [Victivallaceae bacterium]